MFWNKKRPGSQVIGQRRTALVVVVVALGIPSGTYVTWKYLQALNIALHLESCVSVGGQA